MDGIDTVYDNSDDSAHNPVQVTIGGGGRYLSFRKMSTNGSALGLEVDMSMNQWQEILDKVKLVERFTF